MTGKTAEEVGEELKAGNPSIWARQPVGPDEIVFRIPTLKEGGEKVIAERLRQILAGPS